MKWKKLGFTVERENDDVGNYENIFKSAYEKHFPPEFRWRIDKFVVFEPINEQMFLDIVKVHLDKYISFLKGRGFWGISVVLGDWLVNYLKDLVSFELWARNIRKKMDSIILRVLSNLERQGYLWAMTTLAVAENKVFEILIDFKNWKEFYEIRVKQWNVSSTYREEFKKEYFKLKELSLLERNILEELEKSWKDSLLLSIIEIYRQYIEIFVKRDNFKKIITLEEFIRERLNEKDLSILKKVGYYELVKAVYNEYLNSKKQRKYKDLKEYIRNKLSFVEKSLKTITKDKNWENNKFLKKLLNNLLRTAEAEVKNSLFFSEETMIISKLSQFVNLFLDWEFLNEELLIIALFLEKLEEYFKEKLWILWFNYNILKAFAMWAFSKKNF